MDSEVVGRDTASLISVTINRRDLDFAIIFIIDNFDNCERIVFAKNAMLNSIELFCYMMNDNKWSWKYRSLRVVPNSAFSTYPADTPNTRHNNRIPAHTLLLGHVTRTNVS